MIYGMKTHRVMLTECQNSGGPCPALDRMLKALSQALHSAKALTDKDFEITGESLLDGCARHCPARFVAAHDRIRVFCGVSPSADQVALDRFADMMVLPYAAALPASRIKARPCAFGEATPRNTVRTAAQYDHAGRAV